MNNIDQSTMDHQSMKDVYDRRYGGSYMDADAYSNWVHEGLAAYRVRQTLQQTPGSPRRILDYGCGQGKWAPLLRAVFNDAEIVGIDISGIATEKAANKYPDCRFMAFDGERAPLGDAEFDLVFSFHVLEHVLDIKASIHDIARLIRLGGYACIIFPCGNKGSFEERFISLLKNGREKSPTGEEIFFFEKEEGHLRRMESSQTIALFRNEGLELRHEFYSGKFFAALDWLVRGTGPHYINGMFRSAVPVNSLASIQLRLMRKLLISVNRFLSYKDLDQTKKRSALKQLIVRLVSTTASILDSEIMKRARREWDRHRNNKAGSVQYLVFQKTA